MFCRFLLSKKSWALPLLLSLAPASALASACYIDVVSCTHDVPVNQWFQDGDPGSNQDVNQCVARAKAFHDYCATSSASSSFYDDAGNNTYTPFQTTAINATASGPTWANYGSFDLPSNQPLQIGAMSLIMQYDGSLVLYKNGAAVWYVSTGVSDCSACHLAFQSDGNLVVYNGGSVLWQSNTLVAQIDYLQIEELPPYFLMHSANANFWAVVPHGNLVLPDGTVLPDTLSFK